jgi:hypothetical protein
MDSSLTVSGSTFDENYATEGGLAKVEHNSMLQLTDCKITQPSLDNISVLFIENSIKDNKINGTVQGTSTTTPSATVFLNDYSAWTSAQVVAQYTSTILQNEVETIISISAASTNIEHHYPFFIVSSRFNISTVSIYSVLE